MLTFQLKSILVGNGSESDFSSSSNKYVMATLENLKTTNERKAIKVEIDENKEHLHPGSGAARLY